MESKIGSLEWLEDYLFDKLQQIKRNPKYISFCRKVPFNDDGLEYSIESLLDPEADKVRNAFGLALLFDPTKDLPKKDSTILDLYKDPLAVSFEWHKEAGYSTPIWDDHFIRLKIDIGPNRDMGEILAEVQEFIEDARTGLDNSERLEDKRRYFEKRSLCYKVWDMRTVPVPFKKIAISQNISEDTAKKRFKKAFELIVGKEYQKEIWKKLFPRELAQQHLCVGNIEYVKGKEDDPSLFGPSEMRLWYDIERICAKCPDSECRELPFIERIERMKECSKIYQFLEEN